ncbi:MAG: hypothetical protein R2837_09025 [Aliarcobacter sp.]
MIITIKLKKIGVTYFPIDELELNLSRSYSNMNINMKFYNIR